jgi:hypothetical protein
MTGQRDGAAAVETPCDDGPSVVDEAETFLHETLKDGPMATKDVKAAA